jgi:CO/xanthine dehydrogenase Mo-binding subunit
MKKSELIDEINAYGAARAIGNPLLVQRQTQALEMIMQRLAEELPERPEPEPPPPNPS